MFFYRIQPAGLEISTHSSESSEGMRAGVDVFAQADQTFRPDCKPSEYGDEVLVIEADESWSNNDVEGVRVDGFRARIVARFSWDAWCAAFAKAAGLPDDVVWSGPRGLTWEDDDFYYDAEDPHNITWTANGLARN